MLPVAVYQTETITLLDAVTSATESQVKPLGSANSTFQVTSDGSHAGTSLVKIWVSNDNVGWIWKATMSVTGASDSAGFALTEVWKWVKAECTVHGDDTNGITVTMGK